MRPGYVCMYVGPNLLLYTATVHKYNNCTIAVKQKGRAGLRDYTLQYLIMPSYMLAMHIYLSAFVRESCIDARA